MTGIVYTETVVHVAPARLVAEAPYQIAIVVLESGDRVTGRVTGLPVRIGDTVEMLQMQGGVYWFEGIFASRAALSTSPTSDLARPGLQQIE